MKRLNVDDRNALKLILELREAIKAKDKNTVLELEKFQQSINWENVQKSVREEADELFENEIYAQTTNALKSASK